MIAKWPEIKARCIIWDKRRGGYYEKFNCYYYG